MSYFAPPQRFYDVSRFINEHSEKDSTGAEAFVEALANFKQFAKYYNIPWQEALDQIDLVNVPIENNTTLLIGTVQFFNEKHNNDPKKMYGFMVDGTFFHVNQGVQFVNNGGDDPQENGREPIQPKKDDFLLYLKGTNLKGPAAIWWCYKAKYDKVLKEIEARPVIRYYDMGMGITRWEGMNIDKLRMLYPKETGPRPLFDPARYMFQRKDGNNWLMIADPR